MKRRDLINHLEKEGVLLLREGSNHSIYYNAVNNKVTAVPRHREINDFLARKICKDLEIRLPNT